MPKCEFFINGNGGVVCQSLQIMDDHFAFLFIFGDKQTILKEEKETWGKARTEKPISQLLELIFIFVR